MANGNGVKVTGPIIDCFHPRKKLADRWEMYSCLWPNGVRAVIHRNPGRDNVVFQRYWFYDLRTMLDPEIAHLIEHLFLRRASENGQLKLRRNLDSLGEVDAWVDEDSVGFGADVPNSYRYRVIPFLHTLSFLKGVTENELLNEIENIQTEYREDQVCLKQKAKEILYRKLWPRSVFAKPQGGYEQNYSKIGLSDIDNFILSNFTPDRLVLGVAGNVRLSKIIEQISKHFGSLRGKSEKPPIKKMTFSPGFFVSNSSSSGLCGVALAHPINEPVISHNNLDLLVSLNSFLWSSKMFAEIRRSGAYSLELTNTELGGETFLILNFAAKAKNVSRILREYVKQCTRLSRRGPSDIEIKLAKEQFIIEHVLKAANMRMRTIDSCVEAYTQDDIVPYSNMVRQVKRADPAIVKSEIMQALTFRGGYLVLHGNTRGFKLDNTVKSFLQLPEG